MKLVQLLWVMGLLLAGASGRAENGVTDKEIVVGQFAALSGPAAQLGQRLTAGIQAYFKAVNEQGGVHGRRACACSRATTAMSPTGRSWRCAA